ncbi:MAG: DUF4080 domain-containing protein [Rikenellaceae bacterium]
MNLVWLNINSSYSHSSLAMSAIDACRRYDNYNWSQVSATINSDIFLITEQLYNANPTVIASTLWLFNHEVVIKICARIKSLLPEVKIILGGPEFNGNNEQFLRHNSFIDCVLRGEGEEKFHDIIGGVDYKTIQGLCYIDSKEQYIDNGYARVSNFAALPQPEESRFFDFSAPFVQIETSRGCFNTCAFCVSGGDKPIRSKSIDDIEERIENIHQKGIKDIRVLDRTFNYSPQRAKQMLGIFSKFKDMNFHLEMHPALLTKELIKLLAETPKGVLHLEAGMQSLDDKVIEECGRIGTNDKAKEGLKELCKIDKFETHADLIAGLPHYTLAQIYKDVRELSLIGAGEIQLELLKLLPGTKMRNEAAKLEIRFAPTPPYEVLETPSINIQQLNEARLLSKLLDKYYNAKGWQSVVREIINNEPEFLKNFLDFLVTSDKLEQPLSLEKRGSLLYNFCDKHYVNYRDKVSLKWIENGLPIRRKEAGNIIKAIELPEDIIRQNNVHYFIFATITTKYLVCYDRSKEQSKPTLIKVINHE